MAELLGMDEPRKRIAEMLTGLDIDYDLGEGHPLLGRRMPDLDLETADGPTRVFTLLHDARPVLMNLSEGGGFDFSPWQDRGTRSRRTARWGVGSFRSSAGDPCSRQSWSDLTGMSHGWTDDGPGLPVALATWFGAAESMG